MFDFLPHGPLFSPSSRLGVQIIIATLIVVTLVILAFFGKRGFGGDGAGADSLGDWGDGGGGSCD